MSPKTTPIEPSARIQKRPLEWLRVSLSALNVEGGTASFETSWDMQGNPRVVGSGRTRQTGGVYTPSHVALEGRVPSPLAVAVAASPAPCQPIAARFPDARSACPAIG